MLTKDMTRAPGQTESFLLSWTCSYQNPFRLCLPSCVSAPLSQTRLFPNTIVPNFPNFYFAAKEGQRTSARRSVIALY